MDQLKGNALSTDMVSQGVQSPAQLSRRGFLKGSSLAAVGVAVIPAVGLMVQAQPSYAQSFDALGKPVGHTLVRMARDIFPHDKVPDKFYAAAIASYDEKVASDPELKALLDAGVARLNAESMSLYGKPYLDVPGEGERVVVLYAIEQSPFFQKVRGDLIFSLYNNKEVWPLFGYEGSSWEKGGYLDRGFDDIDWL